MNFPKIDDEEDNDPYRLVKAIGAFEENFVGYEGYGDNNGETSLED